MNHSDIADDALESLIGEWTSHAESAKAGKLIIRPLRRDDREREITFVNSLSERTRYLRLHSPIKFLPPHLLDQLMDIDYRRRMAFVATRADDPTGAFVGIARYGETDQTDAIEIGVTVADEWQGRGVAPLLVGQLLRFARHRGFARCLGMVLPENQPMLALARKLGFSSHYDPVGHTIVISLDLVASATP